MLTALLDAHPRISLYYEPWNASGARRPPVPDDPQAFLESMEYRFGPRPDQAVRTIGFKETSIRAEARAWAVATLERMSPRIETRAVWIFRDPIHCLLSKLEGARKWWGYPDARLTRETLARHLVESAESIAAFRALAKRVDTTLVQYDALVEHPAATLRTLMGRIGETFEPSQLDYHEAGPQPNRVMGDVGLATKPRPVSRAAADRRAREAAGHSALIEQVLADSAFDWIRAESKRLAALPAVARIGR